MMIQCGQIQIIITVTFQISNFGPVFISFFNINNDVSYCKGWKKEENIYDGIKWFITIKKDEEVPCFMV